MQKESEVNYECTCSYLPVIITTVRVYVATSVALEF